MIDRADLNHILQLFEAGLSITAISRRVNHDRKTVRKYVSGGSTAAPRPARVTSRPSKLDNYLDYLQQRLSQYPDLTATRLLREIRSMGYEGSATVLSTRVRELRVRFRGAGHEDSQLVTLRASSATPLASCPRGNAQHVRLAMPRNGSTSPIPPQTPEHIGE
jgi:transposase